MGAAKAGVAGAMLGLSSAVGWIVLGIGLTLVMAAAGLSRQSVFKTLVVRRPLYFRELTC
jgi:hypothetical protein